MCLYALPAANVLTREGLRADLAIENIVVVGGGVEENSCMEARKFGKCDPGRGSRRVC